VKASNPHNPQPDIHFRVSRDEYRQLQAVAEKLDRSIAYLMTQIVKDWLNNQKAVTPDR